MSSAPAVPWSRLRDNLLWVDCLGGLIAGALALALLDWLSALYGLPRAWIGALCAANLLYGASSLTLALRATRPRALIHALALANIGWGALCFVFAALLAPSASPWGIAHLLAEGVIVGGLGLLEWRWRAHLYQRPPRPVSA